ncbi:unnamed protein product [Chilo suppressalis]|uniref:N-acetyltransferase domain-containing protein n=1 Tax=Chilo suppressalis TaxID=168631 RepID=A0ABN8B3Y6_CHISP|nr:unnamed protein product [Chilo suppressalis]
MWVMARSPYSIHREGLWPSSGDQRLIVPSEARRNSRQKIYGHPSNDRPLRRLLNFNDRSRTRLPPAPSKENAAIPSLRSIIKHTQKVMFSQDIVVDRDCVTVFSQDIVDDRDCVTVFSQDIIDDRDFVTVFSQDIVDDHIVDDRDCVTVFSQGIIVDRDCVTVLSGDIIVDRDHTLFLTVTVFSQDIVVERIAGTMRFVRITPDMSESVIQHLRESFFADEPLNKAVRLCERGEPHYALEQMCRATIADGLSLAAIEEDYILGVSLNGILKPGDIEEALQKIRQSTDEKFNKIFTILYTLSKDLDLFDKLDVDRILECRIISASDRARGRGLGKEMMKRSIEIAEQENFKIFKADATGAFSQKICRHFGMKVFGRVRYDEYLDSTGNPVFNTAGRGSHAHVTRQAREQFALLSARTLVRPSSYDRHSDKKPDRPNTYIFGRTRPQKAKHVPPGHVWSPGI